MRSRLTYANVVATLALLIAVGGASAFAATSLPGNSVGSRQLKKNAVTAAKIRNGAVTGSKIELSSLGTVPSAAHAASADSAVSASNATQLGGSPPSAYRDRCPAGTSLAAPGVCLGKEMGATDWNAALAECGAVGLRLPTPGEAQLIYPHATSNHPLWTDDFWVNGSTSEALVYWPQEKALYAVAISGTYWVYCVTTPTDT